LEELAEIIGDNPFALIAGTGAIWIRKRTTGHGKAHGNAPATGDAAAAIEIAPVPPEVA
jgi:beta-galactosidase